MTLLSLIFFLATISLVCADQRPNVIFIMSDDMGYSDIGCYGGEIETPNLDGLASGGLRFRQFYNAGRCCPTRASLLSGLYAHQAGVGHMMGDYGLPSYRGDLNRSCLTIAEALRPAGYRTYMSGKWHVTPYRGSADNPDVSNWPCARGFDRFFGTIHGAGSFFDPNGLTRDEMFITPENDPGYQPQGTWYYTTAIADNAVQYVRDHARDHKDQPFFTYVSFTAAHWPMHALPEDIAKYDGRYDAGYGPIREARIQKMKALGLLPDHWTPAPMVGDWDKVMDKEWEAALMEVYAAMVDSMDQGIGKIVASLKETGQYDNTLILFFQDNGGCAETFGRGQSVGPVERPAGPTLAPMGRDELQSNMIPPQSRDGYPLRRGPGVMPGPAETQIGYGKAWANVSNVPFREYKHWVHEGGIATPLIAHWPKGIAKPGDWHDSPSHLIDLMATAVDLGKASYPAEKDGVALIPLEGISLAPAFSGAETLDRGKPLYWEHEGNRAVRDGKWKLVAKGVNSEWELYDMEADRVESNDLSQEQPEIAARLARQYEDWAAERGVVPFGSWKTEKSKEKKGNGKKAFHLKSGDVLDEATAPAIAGRAFGVAAKVDGLDANSKGVVVAQGGSNHGWALYFAEGRMHFSSMRSGERVTASADLPESGAALLEAKVLEDRLVLRADGKRIGLLECAPILGSHPLDGLEVGKDGGGLVGTYPEDNSFTGTIESVEVHLLERDH